MLSTTTLNFPDAPSLVAFLDDYETGIEDTLEVTGYRILGNDGETATLGGATGNAQNDRRAITTFMRDNGGFGSDYDAQVQGQRLADRANTGWLSFDDVKAFAAAAPTE